jgi:nitrite reductase (NADH) small subunit/3-phenylpropionate/trans-cinnamate dioxygenase ferredoxin subunit
MSDFVTVARVGDIAEGRGQAFAVNGRMVAVFLYEGHYHAIDDFCPHMGASLAGGYLAGGVVTCPWHAWRFSICDGTWCDNPRIKIDSFEVRVVGDEIQVRSASAERGPRSAERNGACAGQEAVDAEGKGPE